MGDHNLVAIVNKEELKLKVLLKLFFFDNIKQKKIGVIWICCYEFAVGVQAQFFFLSLERFIIYGRGTYFVVRKFTKWFLSAHCVFLPDHRICVRPMDQTPVWRTGAWRRNMIRRIIRKRIRPAHEKFFLNCTINNCLVGSNDKLLTGVLIEGKTFQNLSVSSPAPVTIVCRKGPR